MPEISLSDFIEIVARSGSPKATKIAQLKARGEYDPSADFYKPIREHIIKLHQRSLDKKALRQVLFSLSDTKKIKKYPPLVEGYKKWWGRKICVWFAPPRKHYSSDGVDIIVNPELGLEYNNEKHIIKLYFKDEQLTKQSIKIVSFLMQTVFNDYCSKGYRFDILDVKNARLITSSEIEESIEPMLLGEMAYIAKVWEKL